MSNELQAIVVSAPFFSGVAANFIGGTLATAAGALPVFIMHTLSERTNNLMLSFAAGVMLAATIFSLLLPGLESAQTFLATKSSAALGIIAALLTGGGMLWLIHYSIPYEHFGKGCEGHLQRRLARIWLFVLAITIHNFPEGLAVGVSAGSGDIAIGLGVTLRIGLQNIPEGLAVALALVSQGYSRQRSFLVACLSGLVEVIGGIIGAGAIALSAAILPWALGIAAGTMLFVISDEVIPETHRSGLEGIATAALFVGFAVMLFLDVTLG